MTLARLMRVSLLVVLFTVLFGAYGTMGQTETATISGLITDEAGANVPDVEVQLLNVQRGTTTDAKTNGAGIYVFAGVQPGAYQLRVHKSGFKQVDLLSLIVNVQDHIEQNVRLQIGSVSESVTVNADDTHINTTDATVSTVVNRQFVENIPLNGRSFQSLYELTPGLVLTRAINQEQGQFSVNGQRTDSNYVTVDGMSANIGAPVQAGSGVGQNASGSLPGYSVLGGTNTLVSVDALQEFRIQTSTYAPEFGRTPGAQISLLTRSGANQFHGTLFEYFRNDKLDANDWFANANSLRKPALRQNDFGGVLGGRLIKDRTFFFVSYEGLRLRLPQTAISDVPSLDSRNSAPPAMQPFLRAYPLPTGLDTQNGFATFAGSYSDPKSLNAGSVRIDQMIGNKVTLFGRYSHTPSEGRSRGGGGPLNINNIDYYLTQTLTVGVTASLSPTLNNDLRFNWSRSHLSNYAIQDTFGGAALIPESLLLPAGQPNLSLANIDYDFTMSGNNDAWQIGQGTNDIQKQVNVIDAMSYTRASHQFKAGVDYRRLAPRLKPFEYALVAIFFGGPTQADTGIASRVFVLNFGPPLYPVFNEYSLFAQDTWKVSTKLTVTYGLRWDYNPPPYESTNHNPLVLTNLDSPSAIAPLPYGSKPLWDASYANFAPRLGVAYVLRRGQGKELVVRSGGGVFYDLGTNAAGLAFTNAPFRGRKNFSNIQFPPTADEAAPAPRTDTPPFGNPVIAFDRALKLPYTVQWNVALEQELGSGQAISATYVGAAGRSLLRQAAILQPNSNLYEVDLTRNDGSSDYNALQLQYHTRPTHGLQALASYTWAHSIDTNSNDSQVATPFPQLSASADRGASDFDVRHSFVTSVTYNIPTLRSNLATSHILGGWATDLIFRARTAFPVTPTASVDITSQSSFNLRPDVIVGVPLELFGAQYPGGKILNRAAFQIQSVARQGDLGRNSLRGFGTNQLDFALRRAFSLRESWKLEFRSELFNILNHPNFGDPVTNLTSGLFGQSTQMLARNFRGGSSQALSPIYQTGGPRSIQLGMKLIF